MTAFDRWVRGLTESDESVLAATLAADVTFVSPFHTWHGDDVRSVCRARTSAFGPWKPVAVTPTPDGGWVRWTASLSDRPDVLVEGVDVVAVSDEDQIQAVDVFLRPASCLGAVHEAMTAHWPG